MTYDADASTYDIPKRNSFLHTFKDMAIRINYEDGASLKLAIGFSTNIVERS